MHVLITGATRGIGARLAEIARDDGAQVTATTRGTPGPGGMDWQALDVTDPASIAAMADRLDGRPIDLLVLNAGVYLDKHQGLEDGFAPEAWAQTFATNVTGPFLCIQALLPNLRAAGGARIAVISSIMGSQAGAPGGGYMYRASKAAVLNVARNLTQDLRPEGIAVGTYHPGWVRTDMGGPNAAVSVEASAAGLWSRFQHLSMDTTGLFETFEGEAIAF